MSKHRSYNASNGTYRGGVKEVVYTAKVVTFLPGIAAAAKAEILRAGKVIAIYTATEEESSVEFVSGAEADLMDAEAARRSLGFWSDWRGDAAYGSYQDNYDSGAYNKTYYATTANDEDKVTAEDIIAALLVTAVVEERTRRMCRKYMVWRPEGRPSDCYRALRFMSSTPKSEQIAELKKRHPRATIYNEKYVESEAA